MKIITLLNVWITQFRKHLLYEYRIAMRIS